MIKLELLFDILILQFDHITKTMNNNVLIKFSIGKLKQMSVKINDPKDLANHQAS